MSKHPNYELFEEIGRGEHTIVYRAWDLLLSRDVAVKELQSKPSSDVGNSDLGPVSQFLKEASFLAQFEHENVLRIHTVDQGRGWIVMELMKVSLASQIANSPMDPDTVRSVVRQILKALEFLHSKDKVHGSVRPSNILINDQGTAKLSDFEASSRDGELRVPVGSKKYLAPELIRSEFGEFGETVDLYCLGFTALELLTGRKFDSLFPGTGEGAIDADVAWMRWHSSDEPMKPIKEIAPRIPDDLASVIDQLLKKPVNERPENAAAVLKLLDDAPFVPVQVVAPVSKNTKPEDVTAILPSKAVKLRDPIRKKKNQMQPEVATLTGKDKLNEMLGKPFVLWPVCIGMLAAAVFIGLYLRSDHNPESAPISDNGKPEIVERDTEPPIEPLLVSLNILPDAEETTLTVGGEPRDLNDLKLEPGQHEIVVKKYGFQSFASLLEIDKENTAFDIVLDALKPEPEIVEATEPEYLEFRISVTPDDAELIINNGEIKLHEGKLRLETVDEFRLELFASADGYESKKEQWSLEQLKASGPELHLSLEKSPVIEKSLGLALPNSLIPKPGTQFDEETELPFRALVKALDGPSPLEMALVVAGNYEFGVTDGEPRTWELSGETIEVSQPFYIGVTEVTSSQYQTYTAADTGSNNTAATGSNIPITNLTIQDAAKFCQWAGGRLPTEKEWEAAARGERETGFPLPWSFTDNEDLAADKCKLFRGEADQENDLVEVGSLPGGANSIGLLDLIGNAAEWCDNQYDAEQFIVKGCSYRIPPGNHVRTTWRTAAKWAGAKDIGMRLLIPVVDQPLVSAALTFVAPTNLDSLLISTGVSGEDDTETEQVYTKTVKEIADEFTGPAELVIDSGGFIAEITDIQFNSEGTQVAVSGDKVVRIWDVNNGALLHTLRGDMSRTSYGNVNSLAWSPDGEHLLVGVSDYREHGNIRVYSTENMDEISEVLTGHDAPTRKLSFSRDGELLASTDSDGMTIVRNWQTREIVKQIPARDRDQPIQDIMTFPTDEPYLLGVDFQGPQIFSALEGMPLGAQDEMPSRIRGWLVDVYNKLIQLPYLAKAQPRVLDFRMEEGRWAGAGTAVVDGRSRFWIRVWESREPVSSAVSAPELAAYDEHRWNVTAISLQPNGTLVASGDKFGEVHVWDSKTGQLKFKFAGQGKPIYEVAFDQNSSQRLAFGTKPHTPKDWNRNNHGLATRVLDLRVRAIAEVAQRDDLQLIREQPEMGTQKVSVRKEDSYYFIEHLMNSQALSRYRISSGRNPTTFTYLDQPKLGVQQPIVFGDNEGLLALWDTSSDELKRAFIGHGNYVSAISSSRNGKLIATSSTDRTIRLWSLENYNPTGIFDFKFENSAVREVVPGTSSAQAGVQIGDKIVAIDGRSLTEMFELMLVGKFDYKPGQTVPVTMERNEEKFSYDMTMADGYDFAEPILNFYMGDNGQWIIYHPQGYYDASPGADRLIGWHINRGYDKSAKYFEVQQFRDKLYRPDVIDGILETGSLQAALASLDGNGSDREEVDFREPTVIAEHHPPGVKITWPTNRWQADSQSVTVKGEATSTNGLPLTALTLLHNGAVAKVFRPTQVNQLSMKIEYEIQLEGGSNDLVLIAANSKASSQGKHVVVDLKSEKKPSLRDAVVLAIGVSEFDELKNLSQAENDATAFVSAMKAHENGKLYGNVKTKLLAGSVGDDEILDGFQWLSDNTKNGDVVIAFITSTGIVDRRDNFYIAATNTRETKARSTAVSWRDLMDTLQLDLPDAKRMVFLDLSPTENSIRPGLRNPLLDLAAPEMGTVFISSNTLQQKSVQPANSGNAAFLQAVLDTVGDPKFDTNPSGDEMLNPVELAAGVTSRVKAITRDRQQPVFFTPEFAKFANVLELQN